MSYSKSKGFTMIELLVVIAIIGILAVIVMSAIAGSKGKANDAKVKSQLASLVRTAGIYGAANNNAFGTASDCSTGMFADVSSDTVNFTNINNYPVGTTLECFSTDTAWAVSASLSTGQYWCVDSADKVTQQATAITTSNCL